MVGKQWHVVPQAGARDQRTSDASSSFPFNTNHIRATNPFVRPGWDRVGPSMHKRVHRLSARHSMKVMLVSMHVLPKGWCAAQCVFRIPVPSFLNCGSATTAAIYAGPVTFSAMFAVRVRVTNLAWSYTTGFMVTSCRSSIFLPPLIIGPTASTASVAAGCPQTLRHHGISVEVLLAVVLSPSRSFTGPGRRTLDVGQRLRAHHLDVPFSSEVGPRGGPMSLQCENSAKPVDRCSLPCVLSFFTTSALCAWCRRPSSFPLSWCAA